jgi:hypothetical protein
VTFKLLEVKGDPVFNAATLIVAGITGAVTGVAIEGLPLLAELGIAVAVGLAVGGALYAALKALQRRRPR